MTQWLTQDTPSGVQVLPLDDLILHTHFGCTCVPVVELRSATCWGLDHGPKLQVRTVTLHNAMDDRQ